MTSHVVQPRFTVLFCTLLIAFLSCAGSQFAQAATLNVPSSNFPTVQSAVNAANPGDTIVLQAGMTFVETVRLKYKPGSEYITIQSSAMHLLPPDGHRVNPSFAGQMPKIVPASFGEPAFYTEITQNGASHHYKLIGLEITQNAANDMVYNLVAFGSGSDDQNALAKVAHHFVVDRCYIHGSENGEVRRGVGLNSRDTEIINSHISEIHQVGYDSQAICGWNGPGNYKIINNYLVAAAENIMFGGADPSIPNLVPADIEIRHNHVTKPMAWRDREPDWTVKNLLELKNARRVSIDRNLFENNWGFDYGAAQNGNAIVFTVRNQDGNAPWSTIEDVQFTNNIVRRAGSGVGVLTTDYTFPSQTMRNVKFDNNLFDQIGAADFGGMGYLFGWSGAGDTSTAQNFEITNNTAFHPGMFILAEEGSRVNGLKVEGNIHKEHILRDSAAGMTAFNGLAGNTWTFRGNAMTIEQYYDYWSPQYPNSPANANSYLRDFDNAQFVNRADGNYRLAPHSPLRNQGADGKNVGVDYTKLYTASASSDFDSDGKTDQVVFRPSNGVWYVAASSDNSVRYFQFGQAGDVPVAADYDADGQTDYAVFRPSNGVWYVWQSSTSQMKAQQFGMLGDAPVPADYDADGKVDVAVYRADASTENKGYWFVWNSATGAMTVRQWGLRGDKPTTADFDGDGKSDAAVYRQSERRWYVHNSFDNSYRAYNIGLETDVQAAGDYDGDGRLDIAVWRPETGFWYIRRHDGSFRTFQFGMRGDKIVPGDYDADGKTDFAVYRPSTGVWYMQTSSHGFKAMQFGLNEDVPTTSAVLMQ